MPGGGREGLLFNGYRDFVGANEKVFIDSGDGYTTLGMYLIPLKCTLKNA